MSGQDDGLEGVTVVEVGEKIPSLTLKTDTGDEISTTALAGDRKGFVIFTYPKANTSGCTNQACGFRDKHDLFLEKGYAVYGLSKDSPASQSSWKEAQSLPYTLLCDPNSELIKPLGCFKAGGGTARCHFVFDKDGTLKEKKLNVKPVESPVDALESVGKL
ncbi:AhpC-TSA-domain-containing protein [Atractiella rhizophila]|nr:AhpC-TSA-domain-containing protein [Atractiella rhizophila]KAH8917321.1 AhpC-TSA-domain-containing protein [Atractiella rhizophila]